MAILLVMARNNTHSDPIKDERGCYKRGDILGVYPDNFEFGRKEVIAPIDGGGFVRIHLDGITPVQLRTIVRNRLNLREVNDPDESDLGEKDAAGNPILSVTRRRRVRLDPQELPANVRQQLNRTGYYSVPWQTAKQFIKDKRTNRQIDD